MILGERLTVTGAVPPRGCLGIGQDDQGDDEKTGDKSNH
jgi:hypothetical protein